MAEQGIEHMISGKDRRENSEKLCLQLDKKGKYVNIGCFHYMCFVKLCTSQVISTGRNMEAIGDGGESNGENVQIWEMQSGRLCLHLDEKRNM